MRRRVMMALLALPPCLVLSAQFSRASGFLEDTDRPIDDDTSAVKMIRSDLGIDVPQARLQFDLSRISDDNIKEFGRAWAISNNGTSGKEGLVLLFRTFEGGYLAKVQHKTNEVRQVTFTWVPNAVAVVHTHPNRNDPKPSDLDMQLANRFSVPMITITLQGMYLYDPATRQTTRVFDGLDWLNSNKWAKRVGSAKPARLEMH